MSRNDSPVSRNQSNIDEHYVEEGPEILGKATVQRLSFFEDQAGMETFSVALAELIRANQKSHVERFLPSRNLQRLRHGRSWKHPGLPHSINGGVHTHSSVTTVLYEDLVNNDLTAIERFLSNLEDDIGKQFAQTFYSTLSAACEKTGNVVDAKAEGSLIESFAKMLELIEFSSDKQGNVQLPEIHMGHEQWQKFFLAMNDAPVDYHKKIEGIKDRKTAEALEREAARKAKFFKYGGEQ